jgi:hypothetical protein
MIDNHCAKWLEPEMNANLHKEIDIVDDAITGATLDEFFK